MSNSLPSDVRTRVDAHLDAVENELRSAGADRAQRRGIVDDLETQIFDMLAARTREAAGPADVDAVLAALDPPSAYSDKQSWPAEPQAPGAIAKNGEPRFCRQVTQGGWCLLGSIVGLALMVVILVTTQMFGPRAASAPFWTQLLLSGLLIVSAAAGVVGPILGTGLGWVACERIRKADGRLYGAPLAVMEAVFFPLIAIWLGIYVMSYDIEKTLFGYGPVQALSSSERARLVDTRILSMLAGLALSAGLVWLLRWSTGPKRTPSVAQRIAERPGPRPHSASMLASWRG
jgi:hypothetical protein